MPHWRFSPNTNCYQKFCRHPLLALHSGTESVKTRHARKEPLSGSDQVSDVGGSALVLFLKTRNQFYQDFLNRDEFLEIIDF